MKTHRSGKQRSSSHPTTQRTRSSKRKTTRTPSSTADRKPSRPLKALTASRPIPQNLELEQQLAARTAELQAALVERHSVQTRYAHILETALAGFWIADQNGNICQVNDVYCRMSGYTRDELMRMKISDLEANETPTDVADRIQLLRQKKSDVFVSRHRRKDGTLFDAEISAALLEDDEALIVVFVQDITERMAADRTLKMSEERARRLVATAPVGIYEMAFDGTRLLSVNDAVCQITGYTREELLAMNPLDLADEASRRHLRERMQHKLAGDKIPDSAEYRIQTKDGRTIDLAMNIGAFIYQDGQPVSVIVVIRDITARKQSEEQTREHLRDLEFLSQTGWELLRTTPATDMLTFVGERVWYFAGDAIVVVNSYDSLKNQTTVHGLYCRPEEREQVVRLFGGDPVGLALGITDKYRAMMVPGKLNPVPGGLYGLCFEQMPEPFCRKVENALKVQSVYAAVFALGDELLGTLAILSRQAGPLSYASVVETFLNQTAVAVQRSHAERALRDNARRYRQIVETAREGILTTNSQAIITYVNQQLATMFGYAPAEMIGQPSLDLIVFPEDRMQADARWERRQSGLSDLVNEFRYRRKDGSPIWVMLSASPLQDPDGKFMGTLALMSDITERRRGEKLDRALNAVNDLIHSTFNLHKILRQTMLQSAEALECDTAAISLREGERWTVRYVHGLPADIVGTEMNDDEERHAVLAIQTKQPIAVDDAFNDERVNREHMRNWGVRSVLVVPLVVKDEALGVIFFNYQQRGITFSDHHLDFAIKLSSSLSLALQNARLFGNLQAELAERRRAEAQVRYQNVVLTGITQIFQVALNCETEEELGGSCLTVAEQMTGSQFGFICELNAEGRLDDIAISDPGWVACQMPRRIGHRIVPGGFEIHGIYGRVLRDGNGFYTNDPLSHPDRIGTPQGHPALTSFLGVPLKQDEKTIGMIAVANREGGYRDEDLQALESLAPAIVQVLMRQRAEHAVRQRKEELEATRVGLENEKRRLQAVMEALPVGLAIFDSHGGDVQANSAYEQMWGSPRPTVRSVDDYGPYRAWWVDSGRPIQPQEWASAQAVQKGIAVTGQLLEIQRFDGSRAFVVNSGAPVLDAHGNIVGCAVAIQDITLLKRAEQRIQKLNADTEQRAQELEVANEELERLATSLAYDLRSPLVSIHSVAQAVAQDYGASLPPQAQELFKLIHANAEEMEQLTQGLLRLMRVTRQPMHKQTVNPGEIVRAVWRELEPEYANRTVEIKIGDLPECSADPLLLKEVWKELLANACKFTRARPSARIEVGATLNPVLARQVGKNGDSGCTYYVRDNGVGFEMSYAGRIFRPFQRYHHADEFGGAGVGLAIVERIIRRLGGRVWAEGAVNQGATVYFAL